MVAIPTTGRETSLANPISPGVQLGICLAVTKYDAVLQEVGKEPLWFKPLYNSLPACIEDCLTWQETLLKYETKLEDIQFLHNPKFSEWKELLM